MAGYMEPREKVVLDVARGVVICKEGRSRGRSDALRLSERDRKFPFDSVGLLFLEDLSWMHSRF